MELQENSGRRATLKETAFSTVSVPSGPHGATQRTEEGRWDNMKLYWNIGPLPLGAGREEEGCPAVGK